MAPSKKNTQRKTSARQTTRKSSSTKSAKTRSSPSRPSAETIEEIKACMKELQFDYPMDLVLESLSHCILPINYLPHDFLLEMLTKIKQAVENIPSYDQLYAIYPDKYDLVKDFQEELETSAWSTKLAMDETMHTGERNLADHFKVSLLQLYAHINYVRFLLQYTAEFTGDQNRYRDLIPQRLLRCAEIVFDKKLSKSNSADFDESVNFYVNRFFSIFTAMLDPAQNQIPEEKNPQFAQELKEVISTFALKEVQGLNTINDELVKIDMDEKKLLKTFLEIKRANLAPDEFSHPLAQPFLAFLDDDVFSMTTWVDQLPLIEPPVLNLLIKYSSGAFYKCFDRFIKNYLDNSRDTIEDLMDSMELHRECREEDEQYNARKETDDEADNKADDEDFADSEDVTAKREPTTPHETSSTPQTSAVNEKDWVATATAAVAASNAITTAAATTATATTATVANNAIQQQSKPESEPPKQRVSYVMQSSLTSGIKSPVVTKTPKRSATCLLSSTEINELFASFQAHYPPPPEDLVYHNNFELLCATMLVSQNDIDKVNAITAKVFAKANTPEAMAALDVEEIKPYFPQTAPWIRRAENLIKIGKIIHQSYHDKVPDNYDDLITLPGVGPRTARKVLQEAFGQAHISANFSIMRVCNRIGLSLGDTPTEIENHINGMLEPKLLMHAQYYLALLGHNVCTVGNFQSNCATCAAAPWCRFHKERH